MNAIEMNAKVEDAHATPRSLYIADANSGNPAPVTPNNISEPVSRSQYDIELTKS